MSFSIREFEPADIPDMVKIWNEVVDAGNAFPQNTRLDAVSAAEFFTSQTFTGVAIGRPGGRASR